MHHIYLASRPNPPDPPNSLRKLLEAREFPKPVPNLGLLESIESAATSLMDFADVSDTKSDTKIKLKNRRAMSKDATKVATEIRRRRQRSNFKSLENDLPSIMDDLNIESAESTIKRILNDNPRQWKE